LDLFSSPKKGIISEHLDKGSALFRTGSARLRGMSVHTVFHKAADGVSLLTNVHVTRRHPVSLIHFVTNRCNARCSFCFIDFDDPKTFRHELTVSEIDKITKTLGPNLQNVNLTGGEPFARRELLDIARCYFRNTKVRSIFITSNGSLPDRIETFLRALTVEFPERQILFSFSIDGLPEEHDRIRKIKDLFENTVRSYHTVRRFTPHARSNIGITISHENYKAVPIVYEALIEQYGIRSITIGLVRDEGVYRIPLDHKRAMLEAYKTMTSKVVEDMRSGRLEGWDRNTLQGRLMNKKNALVWDVVKETYMEPHYISPCRAGSLFGIIEANGAVRPCEILDKPLGNLRDFDYDFNRLWAATEARQTRQWISDTNCHCTYECAWSFNILSNARYQPALIGAALGRDC
jgi:MoaA/NifB/PqqE/SkfB family radical SAM enzyme